MINLLILHELNQKVCTMYGISNQLKKSYSVLLMPSYGTIKPALNRLEESGYINSQKSISKGGRPSVYYAITDKGRNAMKEGLLSDMPNNPSQFLNQARLRLCCSDVLGQDELAKMCTILINKAKNIKIDTENLISKYEKHFFKRMVFDNYLLELNNFVNLLEGVQRAGKH